MAKRKRTSNRDRLYLLTMVLGIAAVGLIAFCMLTPWYSLETSTQANTHEESYTYFDVTYKDEFWGGKVANTIPYSNEAYRETNGDIVGISTMALFVSVLALITMVAFVFLVYGAMMRKLTIRVAALVGIAGLSTAFFVPFYLMLLSPLAFSTSQFVVGGSLAEGDGPWTAFMGTAEGFRTTMAWGPSVSWYLMFVVGFLAFAGTNMCMKIYRLYGDTKRQVKERRSMSGNPMGNDFLS